MNWKHHIKGVPAILARYDEDRELETVPEVGKALALLLIGTGLFRASDLPKRLAAARTAAQFGRVMGAFYDDCDRRAIWVEPEAAAVDEATG